MFACLFVSTVRPPVVDQGSRDHSHSKVAPDMRFRSMVNKFKRCAKAFSV